MPPLTGDPKSHPDSELASGMSGHCLCGSIHVTIKDPDLFSRRRGHLCHCANCRKIAGSYVAANLVIEEDKVTIEDRDGTLKYFDDYETGSGKAVRRSFCGTCGWYGVAISLSLTPYLALFRPIHSGSLIIIFLL
jgi:hypothetical protein